MKSKITRGRDFTGLCRYILRRSAQPELIGGNLCGITASDLAKEFQQIAALRPEIEKPVWHSSLALPKGDKLSDEQWNKVVTDYLHGLGFDPQATPFVVVRHQNTAHDHVHVAASRVSLSGKLYLGKNEHLIATRICQELEQIHCLTITLGLDHKAPAKALKSQEKAMQARTGKVPPRQQLQRAINSIINNNGNLTTNDFIKKLGEVGITAKPNVSKSGKMSGFSFEINGISFKASQLGKAYGWQNLEKRLQQQHSKSQPPPHTPAPPKPVMELDMPLNRSAAAVAVTATAVTAEIASLLDDQDVNKVVGLFVELAKDGIGLPLSPSPSLPQPKVPDYVRPCVSASSKPAFVPIRDGEAKAEARIMVTAPPTSKAEYDQIIDEFCKLQVSKDMMLQQLNNKTKALELAWQQTNNLVSTLQNRKSELLTAGEAQGWKPDTPPPQIWKPLQRSAHAVWMNEFNNIHMRLSKCKPLEIQQKYAIEQASQSAKARQIEAWSTARREIESKPQMLEFAKQNKPIKTSIQIKQRESKSLK